MAIALVGFADAILTARSFAAPGGRPIDANQELVALAGLNAAAGLSQSFPLGSSGSRTAINARVGGRTQVVGLVQVVVAALVLLFLTGVLALLPKATLAAVIIYAAIGLIDMRAWRALWRGSRAEFAIAGVLVVGMITIGLLPSLVLAVLLSIIDVVRTSAQPNDAVLGWSPEQDGSSTWSGARVRASSPASSSTAWMTGCSSRTAGTSPAGSGRRSMELPTRSTPSSSTPRLWSVWMRQAQRSFAT